MGNVSVQYERRDLWRPEAWRRGRGTGILAAGAAADCVADASERQMNTKQQQRQQQQQQHHNPCFPH